MISCLALGQDSGGTESKATYIPVALSCRGALFVAPLVNLLSHQNSILLCCVLCFTFFLMYVGKTIMNYYYLLRLSYYVSCSLSPLSNN